jgi:hypothetical protein
MKLELPSQFEDSMGGGLLRQCPVILTIYFRQELLTFSHEIEYNLKTIAFKASTEIKKKGN